MPFTVSKMFNLDSKVIKEQGVTLLWCLAHQLSDWEVQVHTPLEEINIWQEISTLFVGSYLKWGRGPSAKSKAPN